MTDNVCEDCGMWPVAHTDEHLAKVCLPATVRRFNLQNQDLKAQIKTSEKRVEELETAYRKLMDNNIALAKIGGDLDKKVERLKRYVKEAADVPNYMRRVMHHPPAMTLKPDSLAALETAEVYLKGVEARALSDEPDEGTTAQASTGITSEWLTKVAKYAAEEEKYLGLSLKKGDEVHNIYPVRENGYGSTSCGIRITPEDSPEIRTRLVTCKVCKDHMDGTWIKKMAEREAASEGDEKK